MKCVSQRVTALLVFAIAWSATVLTGCRQAEQRPANAASGSPAQRVRDSLGAGTLISLLRRQATDQDPLAVGHIISCEIGRLHLTVGERRTRELIDSAERVVKGEMPDSVLDRIDEAEAAQIFGGEPCDSMAKAGLLGASVYPKGP